MARACEAAPWKRSEEIHPDMSAKPKVAVFIPSLQGGGAEQIALFVAESLADRGASVDLVVARNVGSLTNHPVATALRVDLGAWNELLCLFRLIRYLRAAKPEILFAMVHTAKIMAGLAKLFVPEVRLIISVHNNLDLPRKNRFWVRRLLGFGPERWLYRKAEAAHAVSDALSAQVVRILGVPRERVHTIYNPYIEKPGHNTLPPEHEPWFALPVLISAGRLVEQKNHAAMLKAFAQSGLAGRATLLILGEGPLRSSLEAEARILGIAPSVIFGGRVPDISVYLRRAAGFVLSSRYEGLPLVLVEALANGLPIVAFDCPTGPAEVLDNGALGRSLVPGDIAGLAGGMADIVSGTLKAAPQAAIDRQLLKFTPHLIADQYFALLGKADTGGAIDFASPAL